MYSIAQKTAMARRVGLLEAFTLEAFSKIEYIISGAFICLRRNRFEMHSYNSLKAMTIVKCCTLIAIQMNSDLFVVFIFFCIRDAIVVLATALFSRFLGNNIVKFYILDKSI